MSVGAATIDGECSERNCLGSTSRTPTNLQIIFIARAQDRMQNWPGESRNRGVKMNSPQLLIGVAKSRRIGKSRGDGRFRYM